MDYTIVLSGAFTALAGIFGYFIKRLIASLDQLQKSFDDEKRHIAGELTKIRGEYLKYDEFARFQTSIDYKLTKIYDLLVGQK